MRPITDIIIHCSATKNHEHTTRDEIKRWHVEENGWSDIGYHWVIETPGHVRLGRPAGKAGAHVKGYNSTSLGICLVGTDEFSDKQMISLFRMLIVLSSIYPEAKIRGHRDYPGVKKTCPGFDVVEWCQIHNINPN